MLADKKDLHAFCVFWPSRVLSLLLLSGRKMETVGISVELQVNSTILHIGQRQRETAALQIFRDAIKPLLIVALFASLCALSLPFTPACPGQYSTPTGVSECRCRPLTHASLGFALSQSRKTSSIPLFTVSLHSIFYSKLHSAFYSKLHSTFTASSIPRFTASSIPRFTASSIPPFTASSIPTFYSKLHSTFYSKLHSTFYSKLHSAFYSKLHSMFYRQAPFHFSQQAH